jgi:hypothetical protein
VGWFDCFKKRNNVEVPVARIWLTKQAKLRGIRSEIREAFANSNGPNAILLVSHFSSDAQELEALSRESGEEGKIVFVAMADDLAAQSPPIAEFGGTQWVLIIVVEHHLLASHDESIFTFAQTLPFRSRIEFHASLDDPILQVFAGDWVKNILKKLGMKDDEAIESTMVAARIKGAQKKIARSAMGDLPAKSSAEWLDINCHGGQFV